ncbi:MAG: hypothetical protein ACI841_005415, partial [Planctomycetota bacterium]
RKEAAFMALRKLQPARGAWQCSACARLYVDGPGEQLIAFRPEDDADKQQALAPSLRP